MIVQCAACQARFKISDDKVTERGVKVRCSKCSTTFVVRKDPAPEPDALAIAAPPTPPPSTGLPARPAAPAKSLAGPDPFARFKTSELRASPDPFGAAAPAAAADPFGGLASAPAPGADPFAGLGAPAAKAASADPFAGLGAPAAKAASPDPFAGLSAPAKAASPDPFAGLGAPGAKPAAADPFASLGAPTPGASADPFASIGGPALAAGSGSGAGADPFGGMASESGNSPASVPGFSAPDLLGAGRSPAPAAAGPFSGLGAAPGAPAAPKGAAAPAASIPPMDLGGISIPSGGNDFDMGTAPSGLDLDNGAAPTTPGKPALPEPPAAAPGYQDEVATVVREVRWPGKVVEPEAKPARAMPAARSAARKASAARAPRRRRPVATLFGAILVAALGVGSGALAFVSGAPATQGQALTAVDLVSGTYPTRAGHPVLFVRGRLLNPASEPLGPVRVSVELRRGTSMVRRADGVAGPMPSAEEIYAIASPASLAELDQRLAAMAGPIEPGSSPEFAVVFYEYPEELADLTVHVSTEPLPAGKRAPEPSTAEKPAAPAALKEAAEGKHDAPAAPSVPPTPAAKGHAGPAVGSK